MAEASTTFLLNKIDKLLSEELRLRGSIEEKIKGLMSEHEMITEVLRGADTLREEGSHIRVWIQQLRSIDHEIVNVLDMYAYKNANGNGNPWYDRWPRMRAHSIAKTIREIETKLRSIKEKREAYLNCFSSHPASTSGEHEAGMISPLHTPEMEIVGVDGPREWLASWVLDVEHAYRVMFVVGTGGSGKTALVKVVYEQLKVEFDCHVWLTAPVFEKMEELLSTMYSKLCNQTGQSSSTSDHTLDDLINMLNDYLRDRRYLIVLDNFAFCKGRRALLQESFPQKWCVSFSTGPVRGI